MSLTKIKDTAAELRFAGNVARTENARSKRGPVGTWKAHLAIAGLSGERREQLVAQMNAALGFDAPAERVGDERLHLYAYTRNMPLQTAGIYALSEFDRMLRQGGLDLDEALENPVFFELEPLAEDEGPADNAPPAPKLSRTQRVASRVIPARLAAKLLNLGPGLGAAAATEFDRGIRQRFGDRSFAVAAKIEGLNLAQATEAKAHCLRLGLDVGEVPETAFRDDFKIAIHADAVGNGIGAILLCLRELGELLVSLPPAAYLSLEALPLADES